MEIRKICQWCGKPFIAQKTTTCYCSHQCSNLGYKERIRERKRQLNDRRNYCNLDKQPRGRISSLLPKPQS